MQCFGKHFWLLLPHLPDRELLYLMEQHIKALNRVMAMVAAKIMSFLLSLPLVKVGAKVSRMISECKQASGLFVFLKHLLKRVFCTSLSSEAQGSLRGHADLSEHLEISAGSTMTDVCPPHPHPHPSSTNTRSVLLQKKTGSG